MNQPGILNARYKGRRIVDPRRMTDEYACIDEVISLPLLEVPSTADLNGFSVIKYEPRFNISQFLPSSSLLNALYNNFNQYRCRSAKLLFESVSTDNVNNRYEVGIYWVPNHTLLDNGHDTPINNWLDFMEKSHTSRVSNDAGERRFMLKYIPQVIDKEEEEEDENELPPVQIAVRSSQPFGWLPTYGAPENGWEHRGPQLIFRQPYSAVGVNARPWTVSLRCVWEFRSAKSGV